jgi:hypothetical protein
MVEDAIEDDPDPALRRGVEQLLSAASPPRSGSTVR